ncbi:MAG: hypothetical protein KAW41_05625 [Candidatus Diapherotrites archaeon]|nr:hypothetical protein [Candidatus Diapherotrites archaeon]
MEKRGRKKGYRYTKYDPKRYYSPGDARIEVWKRIEKKEFEKGFFSYKENRVLAIQMLVAKLVRDKGLQVSEITRDHFREHGMDCLITYFKSKEKALRAAGFSDELITTKPAEHDVRDIRRAVRLIKGVKASEDIDDTLDGLHRKVFGNVPKKIGYRYLLKLAEEHTGIKYRTLYQLFNPNYARFKKYSPRLREEIHAIREQWGLEGETEPGEVKRPVHVPGESPFKMRGLTAEEKTLLQDIRTGFRNWDLTFLSRKKKIPGNVWTVLILPEVRKLSKELLKKSPEHEPRLLRMLRRMYKRSSHRTRGDKLLERVKESLEREMLLGGPETGKTRELRLPAGVLDKLLPFMTPNRRLQEVLEEAQQYFPELSFPQAEAAVYLDRSSIDPHINLSFFGGDYVRTKKGEEAAASILLPPKLGTPAREGLDQKRLQEESAREEVERLKRVAEEELTPEEKEELFADKALEDFTSATGVKGMVAQRFRNYVRAGPEHDVKTPSEHATKEEFRLLGQEIPKAGIGFKQWQIKQWLSRYLAHPELKKYRREDEPLHEVEEEPPEIPVPKTKKRKKIGPPEPKKEEEPPKPAGRPREVKSLLEGLSAADRKNFDSQARGLLRQCGGDARKATDLLAQSVSRLGYGPREASRIAAKIVEIEKKLY